MFKILVNFTMKNQKVLRNCKRKVSFNKKMLSYDHFLKFDEYQHLLMENLGLRAKDARKVLYYQQSVFTIPQEHIVNQCLLCQELNVDTSTLYKNAELLHWPSHTLRHRVMLLQEMGVSRIHAAMVSKFLAALLLEMGLFKAVFGIPKSVNIADNLLRFLHQPPSSVPPLKVLSDNLIVNDYHKQCLQWYLQWRLNLSVDNENEIDHLLRYMKHRSFRLIGRLFDFLHNDIGLTITQIKRYNCLSTDSVEQVRKIISEIKTYGGVDFKTLIKHYPTLHAMEYENVVEVMRLLKAHGFTKMAMRHCPQILVIDSNVVASRLKALEEMPELRVLKNNVNALLLILKFNTINFRLEYLRYLNIKHTTIRTLTGGVKNFKRFTRDRLDLTFGREVGTSLEKYLNLGTKDIRREIEKHPYWRHVDLVTMHDTLQFLLERFALEDIHDSLQLLLYPREKIAETLKNLPELNEKPNEEKDAYTSKRILAICLYDIEREYHFSGDGLWKYETSPSNPRIPVTKSIKQNLSDFSDSEIMESEGGESSSKIANNIK